MAIQQMELIRLGEMIESEMKRSGIWKSGLAIKEGSIAPFGVILFD